MLKSTTELIEQTQPDAADVPLKRRSLKRIGWWIFGITIALFIGLNLLVLAFEPTIYKQLSYQNQVLIPKINLYHQNPRTNVAYMGNSRAYSALDPALTKQLVEKETGRKITSLNFSIYSADVDISYLFLKNIITKDKQPDIVIYGVTELDFRNDFANINFMEYANSILPRLDDFDRLSGDTWKQRASFLARQFVPLYRDHKLIKDMLGQMFNPDDPKYKQYQQTSTAPPRHPEGFSSFPSGSRAKPEAIEFDKKLYSFLQNYGLSQAKIGTMERYIKEAQSRGIKIVLVNMPVTAEHLSWWVNKQRLDQYFNAVQGIVDRTGVPYLDFYDDKNKEFTDKFYDSQHMNLAGADYLTKMVVRKYVIDYYRQK